MTDPSEWRTEFAKRWNLDCPADVDKFIDEWEAKYGFEWPEMGRA